MKCPDCQTALQDLDVRGVTIHECPRCQGRWFDRGELDQVKNKTDEDLRWLDFDPFTSRAERFKTVSEGKVCPGCSNTLLSLAYEKSGVVVDRCQDCGGVWLRHGEFENLIRYLEDLVVSEPASEYVKDSFKQFLEIASGSDDFVSELKDFLAVFKLLEARAGVEHPKIANAVNKIYQYLPFM